MASRVNPSTATTAPTAPRTAHPYHHQTVLGDDKITLRTGLPNKGHEFPVVAEIFGKDEGGGRRLRRLLRHCHHRRA
ncbi:uncharacterized protein K441DRAFT_726804 [Cenococcum geophilum 1.58]|uniref:uncharacterized protein n=1 Tax=Cenococcum geophilum 1.58 TaxID=794803 RepID=UPI00358F7BCF|nr:hypothetical protein K441DRAFT_726804 [Cenococcum geophilum 1.58]